jgi:16S rRNA (guanine(966)-N(2))-methyltransferase RsmD
MRVISGSARGTVLASFKGDAIRPTLDRVKESLFNQIRPSLAGARFLDLFAGTGNIGIEALSQGADFVVFVENDAKAVDLIHKNLAKCRFPEKTADGKHRWALLKTSATLALKKLAEQNCRFDFAYIDPPFHEGWYDKILPALDASPLLNKDALVIVERFRKTDLAENYGTLSLIKDRRIGDTCLSFFARPAGTLAPASEQTNDE